MLARLGLAYAINMHQAQGMTADRGIGVMHSAERQLSSQRLAHVMVTRVRDDLTIFTNDRDQLLRSIQGNPGDKASALEVKDGRNVEIDGNAKGGEHGQKTAPRDPFAIDPASLRSDRMVGRAASRESELKVPVKKLDLGFEASGANRAASEGSEAE